jgi:DNA-binding NarL/FixJ family response regulator
MRVLVVDDHPVARHGFASLVRGALRVDELAEAGSPQEALAAAERMRPDLVLLDLRMPGDVEPSRLVAQIRSRVPGVRVAIVTACEDPELIERCFAAGADGCVLKDTEVAEVRASLQAIAVGRRVIDPRIAQALAAEHVRLLQAERRPVHLTERERDVLSLLAEGCSNRRIADRLYLAETTVKGHVSALLDKLDARSRLQAVVNAREHGLV